MKLEATGVVLKPGYLLAQMYDSDLDTILHELLPDEVGYMLPGVRAHLWHTFQYVVTPEKWGWVTTDAVIPVGAVGSRG